MKQYRTPFPSRNNEFYHVVHVTVDISAIMTNLFQRFPKTNKNVNLVANLTLLGKTEDTTGVSDRPPNPDVL